MNQRKFFCARAGEPALPRLPVTQGVGRSATRSLWFPCRCDWDQVGASRESIEPPLAESCSANGASIAGGAAAGSTLSGFHITTPVAHFVAIAVAVGLCS